MKVMKKYSHQRLKIKFNKSKSKKVYLNKKIMRKKIHYHNSQMQLQNGHKNNIVKMLKKGLMIIQIMIQQLFISLNLNGLDLVHLWNNFGKSKVKILIRLSYSSLGSSMSFFMMMLQLGISIWIWNIWEQKCIQDFLKDR